MRLGLNKVHRKKVREKKEIWEGYGEKKRMLKEKRKYIVPRIFIYLWFKFKSLPDFIGTN